MGPSVYGVDRLSGRPLAGVVGVDACGRLAETIAPRIQGISGESHGDSTLWVSLG